MTGSIKLAGKLTRPTTKSNKMTYEFSIRPQSKWKMHVTNFITLDSCGFLKTARALCSGRTVAAATALIRCRTEINSLSLPVCFLAAAGVSGDCGGAFSGGGGIGSGGFFGGGSWLVVEQGTVAQIITFLSVSGCSICQR